MISNSQQLAQIEIGSVLGQFECVAMDFRPDTSPYVGADPNLVGYTGTDKDSMKIKIPTESPRFPTRNVAETFRNDDYRPLVRQCVEHKFARSAPNSRGFRSL